MDPITILAGLAPLAIDLGKSLINKYITPDIVKPANVDEYMKLRQFDLDMFKAMNEVGGSNPSYPWVEAIVRLQRPVVASVVLLTWVYTKVAQVPSESVDNFAAAIGFYLFADRTLFYAKNKMK
jgi:hypothetical protein